MACIVSESRCGTSGREGLFEGVVQTWVAVSVGPFVPETIGLTEGGVLLAL